MAAYKVESEDARPMSKQRLTKAIDLAYAALMRKIDGGRIVVENEASLQLQFASILKVVGELLEAKQDEYFTIELEKPIKHAEALFGKSGSEKAKIDVYCAFTNASTKEKHGCAVEMKFFKKTSQREPNNRYDVFADLHNLENYGAIADQCYMIVVTNHPHYVKWKEYSGDTSDFDFRDGSVYTAGTTATYRKLKPYGSPIKLDGSYAFNWDKAPNGMNFLKVPVVPRRSAD